MKNPSHFDFFSHEEPFSGTLISASDFYNHVDSFPLMSFQENQESKSLINIQTSLIDFAGKLISFAGAQVPMTISAVLGAGRSAGVSYAKGLKNLESMPRSYGISQVKNMYGNRVKNSLLPMTASNFLVSQFSITTPELVAINTAISTGITSSAKRESGIKFHAINGLRFAIVDDMGNSVNLLKLTKEEFDKFCKNSEKTKNFGEKDWLVLQDRKQIYNTNRPYQTTAMCARNAICALSAFVSRPISKIVEEFGEQIESKTKVSKEATEVALSFGIFSSLCWMSTIFDNAFNQMSSGKMSAENVLEKMSQELSQGNAKNLFAGAVSRMAFCAMATASIYQGSVLSKWFLENIADISEPKISKTSSKVGKILSENSVDLNVEKLEEIQEIKEISRALEAEVEKLIQSFLEKEKPSGVVESAKSENIKEESEVVKQNPGR